LGFGALPSYTLAAAVVSLMFTGIFFALRFWLVRHEYYGDIAKATVAQSAGRITAQLGIGAFQSSPFGLIIGEVVGRGLGLSRMLRRANTSLLSQRRTIRIDRLRSVARTYRKFPLFTMPATLLDSLSPALHVPMISGIFGVAAAGQYSIANM